MEDWSKFADMNSGALADKDLADSINDLIEDAQQAVNAEQSPRNYLGVSYIGEDCLRKIQFMYQNAERDPFTGKTLRIFDRGHWGEDYVASLFKKAGFTLKTEDSNGDQFGFTQANDRFAGHCDGVFTDGPDNFTAFLMPALWEHKTVGVKAFKKIKDEGLAASKPVYHAQMALYQAYLGLEENPGLFTAMNADTMEIYPELIPFDAKLAQAMTDRAVDIITSTEAGALMPRCASKPDFWICRMCDFHSKCWG